MEKREYRDLSEVISFKDFNFNLWYTHEHQFLRPRLEALGYTHVAFSMGERDSFGPLTRIVTAVKDGKTEYFVYG